MNMRFMMVTVLDLIHSFPLLLTMSLNQLSILFKFAHWRPFDAKTDVELRRIPAFKRICEFASQPPFASRLRTPTAPGLPGIDNGRRVSLEPNPSWTGLLLCMRLVILAAPVVLFCNLEFHGSEPQCVRDYRYGAETHSCRCNHWIEQQPKCRVQHPRCERYS